MRCRDLLCQHSEKQHDDENQITFGLGPCKQCPCERFREVTPRHQQLQIEFAKLSARGLTYIPWLSIPDPTAERKPDRGIDTAGYL